MEKGHRAADFAKCRTCACMNLRKATRAVTQLYEPYFAAIDQILRADVSTTGALLALLYYNIVFILPHAVLIIVRLVAPAQSERIFKTVGDFTERWGRRLIIAVLLIVGLVLIADAISWWFGSPLLPVFPPE